MSETETEPQQPDMQSNLLKIRKTSAATRADQAVSGLAARGGNPLAGALADLEGAWVSPARERTTFAENLDGAGTAVTGAFRAQGDRCRGDAAAEPSEVDADDPAEGWKASSSRIDARVSAAAYIPGGR